jgi:hypothetical protein
MFQAYTYYLYHVPTGKKYYGSRAANKCEPEQDLWQEYFSSSELVEELIKEYGKESFIAEVRKKFDVAQDARAWEDRVLRKLKAPKKEDWLNQAYMSGPCYYGNWNGRKHKEVSIQKMRNAKLGKIATEETKQKIRDNHPRLSGKEHHNFGKRMSEEDKAYLRATNSGEGNPFFGKTHDEETRKLMKEINSGEGNPMFGKNHDENTIQKMKNKKWIYNPESLKSTKINKDDIIPAGWILGRYYPSKLFSKRGEENINFGKRWIYNIETLKNARIDKDCQVPDGWVLGKKHKPKSIGLSVTQNTQEI